MKPLITIAIINFNYGRFLEKAINSALSQESEDFILEVLLIDDGSTDESDNIANKHAKITNFKHSKTENKGFGFSLTRAVLEAKGDYLFFLDADDYFEKDKVIAFLKYFEKGYDFVCDTSSYINAMGQIIGGGAAGSTSTIAIRKESINFLLPVENELSFHFLLFIGKGIILKQSFTRYRIHDKNMTDRKIAGKWNDYLGGITIRLAQRIFDLSKKERLNLNFTNFTLRRVSNLLYSRAYYNYLEADLEIGNYISSWKHYFQMIYYALKSKRIPSRLHFKMLVRTIFQLPSFPK
jgi:glycosyltransferase involved in cell wall biosynthesis